MYMKLGNANLSMQKVFLKQSSYKELCPGMLEFLFSLVTFGTNFNNNLKFVCIHLTCCRDQAGPEF